MDFVAYILGVVSLCYKHRGSVTSWGRTEQHNREVGGVFNSNHLLWLGCDVVLDGNEVNHQFESDAQLFGLSALWEKDHYHLQPLG